MKRFQKTVLSGRAPDRSHREEQSGERRHRLSMDGAPAPLHRALRHWDGDPAAMGKGFYVQWKSGDLAPGSYTLVGVWYGDYDGDGVANVLETKTQTLHVTP